MTCRFASPLAALLIFPMAAAAAEVPIPDRCDTALLTKMSAMPDGAPFTAFRAAEQSGKITHDANDPDLSHGQIAVDLVCDGAVSEFMKGDALRNVWTDPKTHKASDLKTRARLLLYVNAIFKKSDAQAVPVFRLASAILEKTDKAGVLWLSKNKRTLTRAYGGPGADRDVNDVIDATDVADVGTPLPGDVAAVRKELIGDDHSAPAGVVLSLDVDSRPGALIVEFNQAIVDWINELAVMQATKPNFRFNEDAGDQAGKLIGDVGLPIPAKVDNVSDNNFIYDPPAMKALVKEFTGLDAVVNWGDDSASPGALGMIDKAQRNALAIRFAQVEMAMNLVAPQKTQAKAPAVRAQHSPTLPALSSLSFDNQ